MKNSKRIATLAMLAMTVTLFLSGCMPQKMSSHPKVPTGFIYGSSYKYIAVPLQHIMERIADFFGGINGYGLGDHHHHLRCADDFTPINA
ncbi:hypothetical protein QY884_05910 [Latilactobacillus sakei]